MMRTRESCKLRKYSSDPSREPSLTISNSKWGYVCRSALSTASGRCGMALQTGMPMVNSGCMLQS